MRRKDKSRHNRELLERQASTPFLHVDGLPADVVRADGAGLPGPEMFVAWASMPNGEGSSAALPGATAGPVLTMPKALVQLEASDALLAGRLRRGRPDMA